uniref:Uncharacterized protein n=1 Tax=Rousettus aegyptiacus TaxID=9407 RepID=A0A7J8JI08_ROUAE|nr:hypothetical protein HJG63_010111 [Rousettus aegyptiacus]
MNLGCWGLGGLTLRVGPTLAYPPLDAALFPSKCPRKPEPPQATNGSFPRTPARPPLPPLAAGHLRGVAPVLHSNASRALGPPPTIPPALGCPALPSPPHLPSLSPAPLRTPRDTGGSLRRGSGHPRSEGVTGRV